MHTLIDIQRLEQALTGIVAQIQNITPEVDTSELSTAITELQTAVAAKADASAITNAIAEHAANVAPPAWLWMTDKDLYIICQHGFIRDTDRINFARYVSTKDCVRLINNPSNRIYIRKRGWKVPLWYDTSGEYSTPEPCFTIIKDQVTASEMDVPVPGSEYVIRSLPRPPQHVVWDYWQLGVEEGEDDHCFANELYSANGESLFADEERKATEQGGIDLHHHRLGVRVERPTVINYVPSYIPITDWMPFGVVWDDNKGEPYMARKK